MYKRFADISPMRKNMTIEDPGNLAVFFAAVPLQRITGKVLYVDSGSDTVGIQMSH